MGTILTARQAAARVGLSEKTIRRRLQAGTLPGVKVQPNRWHIDADHLPPRARDTVRDQLRDQAERLAVVEAALDSLYRAIRPPDALRADSERVAADHARLYVPVAPRPPVPPTGAPGTPLARRAVARWVTRHSGLSSEYIRKEWPRFESYGALWIYIQRTRAVYECEIAGCECHELARRRD